MSSPFPVIVATSITARFVGDAVSLQLLAIAEKGDNPSYTWMEKEWSICLFA